MAAITFEQFRTEALRIAVEYPTIAERIALGDPHILAELSSQARMLAMLSEQIELARFEPFERARDAVVLADATARGIMPFGRPAVVTLAVANRGSTRFSTRPGRIAIDERGRRYQCMSSTSVDAGATQLVRFIQRTDRTIRYTAASGGKFARIEVPTTELSISGISLWRVDGTNRTPFVHRPDMCNSGPGDSSYALETDEFRRVYIRFGAASIIGYELAAGDVFEIVVSECHGRMDSMRQSSVWTWESVETVADGAISMTLSAIEDNGADPPKMRDMRILSRYPTAWNANAVHLGNFEFNIRREFSGGLRFLSVWNEQIEEAVRGPDVRNINRLFVAGMVEGMQQQQFRDAVTAIVKVADDSMVVRHVDTIAVPVPMTVRATVSALHDEHAVTGRIRDLLLAEFGDGAPMVSVGMRTPLRESVMHRILRERIPELRDDSTDINISIHLPDRVTPEMFLHLSFDKLDVSVSKYDVLSYGVAWSA